MEFGAVGHLTSSLLYLGDSLSRRLGADPSPPARWHKSNGTTRRLRLESAFGRRSAVDGKREGVRVVPDVRTQLQRGRAAGESAILVHVQLVLVLKSFDLALNFGCREASSAM